MRGSCCGRSGRDAPIQNRDALPPRNSPVGSLVHAVERKPGKGAQIARAAGWFTPREDPLVRPLFEQPDPQA